MAIVQATPISRRHCVIWVPERPKPRRLLTFKPPGSSTGGHSVAGAFAGFRGRRRCNRVLRDIWHDRCSDDCSIRADACAACRQLFSGIAVEFLSQAVEAVSQAPVQIAVAAYLAALIGIIIVELRPRGRLGRVAAWSLIALAFTGGTAWSYAALYERSTFPLLEAHKQAAAESDEPVRYRGRGGGRESDPDDETDNGRAGDRDDHRSSRGASVSESRGASSGPISVSQTLGQALGLAARVENNASDAIVDCDGCPPMIMVPAGSTLIGASDADPDATPAERPQTPVRFWPGFLISIEPIDAASFEAYMTESGTRVWSCGARTASLSSHAHVPAPSNFAGCVMPGDADGYARWLSARTGRSFRVPTAAEWEYAARTLPEGQMVRGDIAEIAADCWHTQIPPQGHERIAARASVIACDGRTVMGTSPMDVDSKGRVSARSKLSARETRADIGFRVMRTFDRGH